MRTIITCMGECLIDFLPTQKEETTVDFRLYPAGSLLNVAVGIARFGEPAAWAGRLADDYFGRYLFSYMQTEGIDTRFLVTGPGHTALAFVAMEAGQPAYTFYGAETADTQFTLADISPALLQETAILHCGSISLLRGTTPETVIAVAEQLKGQALLSLDPNIRPEFVQQHEQDYRARLHRLITLADILKLSDTDLAWLRPGIPLAQTIAELLASGPALVIVTHGAGGATVARTPTDQFFVPAFPVTTVDTVGAGDTFSAALLAQLLRRRR